MFIRQVFCSIISLILLLCSCSSEKTSVIAPDKVKWPGRESPRDEIIGKRTGDSLITLFVADIKLFLYGLFGFLNIPDNSK